MRRPDLMPRIMSDMDPDLYDFVTTYITSFAKWDLVTFFHDHSRITDTVDNIARYTGRSPQSVRDELEELARLGLLEEMALGDVVVYALTSDAQLRARLERFVRACDDPDFRKKVIYHVIRGTE